jgi:hypothetical protein
MPKYKSPVHQETMIKYLKLLGKIYPDGEVDREYLAALYIICSDDELRRKCLKYIDLEVMGINFPAMRRKEDFSSGYGVLVKLASNLFNEYSKVTPMDIIRHLSGEFFELAIQAILLRKFNGPIYEKELLG